MVLAFGRDRLGLRHTSQLWLAGIVGVDLVWRVGEKRFRHRRWRAFLLLAPFLFLVDINKSRILVTGLEDTFCVFHHEFSNFCADDGIGRLR